MGDKPPKEQTLEDLEKELKQKKLMLESPFAAVGVAVGKQRGRPAKVTSVEEGSAVTVAHEQRMSEITRPASDLSSEGMRDWGEKELHKLIPEAVAGVKWDLKYGDAKQRSDAADRVFKATGIAQKDVSNFGKGGQIVINLSGPQGINLPFLQRNNTEPTVPVMATIEADNTAKKKEDK